MTARSDHVSNRTGPQSQRDPKEIITPDAFRVAPDLLGLPLAAPWRRAGAMLADLTLIGALVLLKAASGTLFGFLLAWVLFRISSPKGVGALQGTPRAFARIAAILVLMIALGSFLGSCVLDGPRPGPPASPETTASGDSAAVDESSGISIATLGRSLGDVAALRRATTAAEARGPASRLAATLARAGAAPSDVRDVLEELIGVERGWRDSVVREVVAGAHAVETERAADADSLALRYAAALTAGDTQEVAAVRERLVERLAATRISSLELERDRLREERDRAREEADQGPGFIAFMRGLADDLGLGFGWAGLYFTAFLTLWKGQTPGKRLFGLRVLQLSGRPLGWWPALERFGGYAASLATGLLGFFQILWDANRQGVHDKIVGTVVVRDSTAVKRAMSRAARATPARLRTGDRTPTSGSEHPEVS